MKGGYESGEERARGREQGASTSTRKARRARRSLLRGETFLKIGKAKFIATREIVIEFVF